MPNGPGADMSDIVFQNIFCQKVIVPHVVVTSRIRVVSSYWFLPCGWIAPWPSQLSWQVRRRNSIRSIVVELRVNVGKVRDDIFVGVQRALRSFRSCRKNVAFVLQSDKNFSDGVTTRKSRPLKINIETIKIVLVHEIDQF